MIGDTQTATLKPANTRHAIAQKEKTDMCKYILAGVECPFAGQCSFAHTERELRMTNRGSHHYKTRKCKNFHQGNGVCPYGSKCRYIHSEVDSYLEALYIYQQFGLNGPWQDTELVTKQLPSRLVATDVELSGESRLAHVLS